MNNELSRAALMAVAGGVIAGVSFIAGKREGATIGNKKIDVIFELGRVKGLVEGIEIGRKMKAEKDIQEGN